MNSSDHHIRLSEGQRRYIASRAAKAGVEASQYLDSLIPSVDEQGNLLLRPIAADAENALQAAQRLGLVGATTGEPADLATNPAHLEGLGNDAPNHH